MSKNMTHIAKVLDVDELIEEKIFMEIAGVELFCFAHICPYPLKQGGIYRVRLQANFFEEALFTECDEGEAEEISFSGIGFSYSIAGRISSGVLTASGISFRHEYHLSDLGYPDGKLISVTIDRLDVEFL